MEASSAAVIAEQAEEAKASAEAAAATLKEEADQAMKQAYDERDAAVTALMQPKRAPGQRSGRRQQASWLLQRWRSWRVAEAERGEALALSDEAMARARSAEDAAFAAREASAGGGVRVQHCRRPHQRTMSVLPQ